MSKFVTKEEAELRLASAYPDWELRQYNGMKNSAIVVHTCGYTKAYGSFEDMMRNGPYCKLCNENIKWSYNIGDIVNNVIVTNRVVVLEKHKQNRLEKGWYETRVQKYQYACLKCGFDGSKGGYVNGEFIEEHWTKASNLSCACCSSHIVQSGVNDIATTDPDLVKFFVDKTLTIKYSRGCNTVKTDVLCPCCNTVHHKPMQIVKLVNEGFTCIKCGNTMSYPERFMYYFLKALDIEFAMHKSFEWSKNVYHENNRLCGNKFYDFYIPCQNLIIEAHGLQHYDPRSLFKTYVSARTFEEEAENDVLKKNIATDAGLNYVVIDCRNSNKSQIVSSIKQSCLGELFDINNINWDDINKQALQGIQINVINDKRNNPELSTVDLAKMYGIHPSTVHRWLKRNAELSGYDTNNECVMCGIKHSKPIYCPELHTAFRSAKIASDATGIDRRRIYESMNGIKKYAGIDKNSQMQLSFKKLTLEQYEKWLNTLENNT